MGLKFGTSGVRGLAVELTDYECYVFTLAFFDYLEEQGVLKSGSDIAVAGDLRPSTGRIMRAVALTGRERGFRTVNCGLIPSPAVALYGFRRRIPSIMVTGSHIPDDRNGIKYNLPKGEVLKDDEIAISARYEALVAQGAGRGLFNEQEGALEPVDLGAVDMTAHDEYIERYNSFFPAGSLEGKKIVVYEHTSVQRDILPVILERLGARVIRLARADAFVPVDTEAVRPEDIELAKQWAAEYEPDAIVSADGDGDRPLVFDGSGHFLRGDLLGAIVAAYLKADSVSVTASANTAVEKCGLFHEVRRTRIGSPYVIAAMNEAVRAGYQQVVSYEANGGFLTATEIDSEGRKLAPLPTRDALLPILSVLEYAANKGLSVAGLVGSLPQRFVYSTSIKGVPIETSREVLALLRTDDGPRKAQSIFALPAPVASIDFLDGARMFLENGEIVHIRPSGNAPELRTYSEAATVERAEELTHNTLEAIRKQYIV